MPQRRSDSLFTAAAYLLALSSILVTRILKAFTVAEVLAVAAFVCGLAAFLIYRRRGPVVTLAGSKRLLITGSVVGLAGLPLKALFSLIGIGADQHDMADHATAPGNPLLIHIHHVFFNLGFLILLISAVVLVAGRVRARNREAAT